MSVIEYMDGAFPSKACIKRAIDKMFEPNPDFHRFIEGLKRKEVRKKMAIDYKEEWEKFKVYYGGRGVALKIDEAKEGRPVNLGALMDNWIDDAIESREGLMQEYVRVGVKTEIVGGEAAYHTVKIIVRGHTRGCISISKDAFREWLKERMKGGK